MLLCLNPQNTNSIKSNRSVFESFFNKLQQKHKTQAGKAASTVVCICIILDIIHNLAQGE